MNGNDKIEHKCICVIKGHKDFMRTLYFVNSFNLLASASDDRTLRLWETNNFTCVAVIGKFLRKFSESLKIV